MIGVDTPETLPSFDRYEPTCTTKNRPHAGEYFAILPFESAQILPSRVDGVSGNGKDDADTSYRPSPLLLHHAAAVGDQRTRTGGRAEQHQHRGRACRALGARGHHHTRRQQERGGINDHRQVVGVSLTASGDRHASLLERRHHD